MRKSIRNEMKIPKMIKRTRMRNLPFLVKNLNFTNNGVRLTDYYIYRKDVDDYFNGEFITILLRCDLNCKDDFFIHNDLIRIVSNKLNIDGKLYKYIEENWGEFLV